jgi:hydroxyacylglutathione hydrolase
VSSYSRRVTPEGQTGRDGSAGGSGAREIAPGVHVFASPAYALNSGVILGGGSGASGRGDRPSGSHDPPAALLVDPGYFPSDLDRISSFLSARGAEPRWIVLTHSDWDHIAGPARFPSASTVASSRFPDRVADRGDSIVHSLEEFDRKLYVRRERSFEIPVPSSLVGAPSDLVWDGPRTKLLPAGGHTPDGLMLLAGESRVLFAGDHLSELEIPFVGDSLAAYRSTLSMVRRLVATGEAETLVPGHGEPCGRDEILLRIDEDEDYLDRLERWVRETRRTVDTIAGVLERCDEVVFRKGWENPDVHAEHRDNVALIGAALGLV